MDHTAFVDTVTRDPQIGVPLHPRIGVPLHFTDRSRSAFMDGVALHSWIHGHAVFPEGGHAAFLKAVTLDCAAFGTTSPRGGAERNVSMQLGGESMDKVESHRDLIVWQKAMDLAVKVYEISSAFPKTEQYRLTSQVTRAAASVPANIAEGHSRGTRKEYAHFLSVARGSLAETETFLLLGQRLKYVTEPQTAPALALMTEVSKMLTALRGKLLASV